MMSHKYLIFCILLFSLTVFGQLKTDKAYQILKQDLWVDQNNKKFQIIDYKNQWLFATIVYSECTSICPMNVQAIKKFEKQLLAAGADPKSYQFVLVSIKSKDETRLTMSKFMKKSGVNLKNWIYIKSDEAHTRELTNEVDMSFGPTYGASRHIMHSSKVALISPAGILTDVFMTGELDQKSVDLVLKRLGE